MRVCGKDSIPFAFFVFRSVAKNAKIIGKKEMCKFWGKNMKEKLLIMI